MLRRTPLRRSRVKPRRTPSRAAYRLETWQRAQGRCDLCGELIREEFEEHHIFLRSQTDKRIFDEPWNRACLHRGCHHFVHQRIEERRALEKLALKRLLDPLTPPELLQLQQLRKGTTPTAMVRAYATWKRYGDPIT